METNNSVANGRFYFSGKLKALKNALNLSLEPVDKMRAFSNSFTENISKKYFNNGNEKVMVNVVTQFKKRINDLMETTSSVIRSVNTTVPSFDPAELTKNPKNHTFMNSTFSNENTQAEYENDNVILVDSSGSLSDLEVRLKFFSI